MELKSSAVRTGDTARALESGTVTDGREAQRAPLKNLSRSHRRPNRSISLTQGTCSVASKHASGTSVALNARFNASAVLKSVPSRNKKLFRRLRYPGTEIVLLRLGDPSRTILTPIQNLIECSDRSG